MCIFDHLFRPHPKCKWNKFLFTNLIWMPFIYFILFCHLCMKHGSLVKFSKIAKNWSWSIAFSTVGIFYSLAKDWTWSFLQFCQVEFLCFGWWWWKSLLWWLERRTRKIGLWEKSSSEGMRVAWIWFYNYKSYDIDNLGVCIWIL
jgi:hypothetical protein